MRHYAKRLGVAAALGGALTLAGGSVAWAAPSPGTITTVGGNGHPGYAGDGGLATAACLNNPAGLAMDGAGDVFVADFSNNVVREITNDGKIKTFAGAHTTVNPPPGCPRPGEHSNPGRSGDGGQATSAQLNQPSGVAFDSGSGNVYIADFGNNVVRKVNPAGIISLFAGNYHGGYSGDGGRATSAMLNRPAGVAVDHSGDVFIADRENNVVREVNTSGIISTVAGNGHGGYSGDGGPATSAMLNHPSAVWVTGSTLYIADTNNNVVRRVSGGTISTVAGNGHGGYSGDGGPATSAMLNTPLGLGMDSLGDLLIADSANHRIRQVAGGTINTVAGNGHNGYSGDGGSCTAAMIDTPTGVVATTNDFIFSDTHNQRLRQCHYPQPALAESSLPVTLPIAGAVAVAAFGLVVHRRRRASATVAG